MCDGFSAKGQGADESMAIEGFTRGDATNEHEAAIDDGIINDDEEEKMSDEPDDGESLDANLDE